MNIHVQIIKSMVYAYIKASIRRVSIEYLEISRIIPCSRLENLWWALNNFGATLKIEVHSYNFLCLEVQ